MRLTCKCTNHTLCLHCQDVRYLRMIAGRLTAKRNAILLRIAAAMDKELSESYAQRDAGKRVTS